jgi:putative glutamine amidotransferase
MKPIIGITVDCENNPNDSRTRGNLTLNWNYAERVAQAGGVPILIPPTADPGEVLKLIDGWLIPGGNDIDAEQWGEENHEKSVLQDPARFAMESDLYRHADANLPILGICYGCQFLNVVRGGSLMQHLPDVEGGERHLGGTLDAAQIEVGSLLSEVVETEVVEGKSYHHQAVARVGDGLKVSARHEDGTVEALEADDRPWLIGVQWHPERTPDDPATRRLFQSFIEAAAQFALERRGAPATP